MMDTVELLILHCPECQHPNEVENIQIPTDCKVHVCTNENCKAKINIRLKVWIPEGGT